MTLFLGIWMSLVQFGDKWVKVRDNIYYLTDYEVEALKMWYGYSLNNDTTVTDEERANIMEYLTKGLDLLNPRDRGETLRYIAKLEYLYENTTDTIMEIINRIYANKTVNEWEVIE